jgi:hypothetical protein
MARWRGSLFVLDLREDFQGLEAFALSVRNAAFERPLFHGTPSRMALSTMPMIATR